MVKLVRNQEVDMDEETEAPTTPAAPPDIATDEAALVVAVDQRERGLVARLQEQSPEVWQSLLKNRTDLLERVRRACLSATVPEDWTLFKGPGGDIVGVPRKSACVRMRKLMGISPSNYRPKNSAGDAEPAVEYEDVAATAATKDKSAKPAHRVTIVTMIANGYCDFTGEYLEDVRHAVRSDDGFTGRGTVQDLAQSCRTGLDSKITRMLADVVKVPVEVLQAHGVNTEKCYKGAGFGTAKDRGARGVAEEGIPERAGELGREVLSRTGGDKEAARSLLVDITKKADGSFKGFDSVDRFTKEWQIEQALERLKKHDVFGDAMQKPTTDEAIK